ncbi:Ribonucleoside-diphosphate reductase small chain [Psilocybe cubensis]|uniref:Ribonucleoside-diphosphate reductase small chain n=5 Tax=Psilocybe cubensis TaxID=181762 RepID=A0ACB8GQP9_PSICU|nr:Ribonucleoside-diphosphate reductase small chain [Psilocybe cubensis]XP_047744989.1 Ribonucleoside-diphosphate reductase small chain [Psilocybe cubensis]XP_047747536.1 Ribonucleoside-diphosphate reductase small chain [Psilocybe cubensis]KAH9474294.1 Ribonucleoside-diphosphate reductase small chain [Psilocybe cubensis]KAH9477364.1 Ribonucleoside-diphosphate reductase small chain [Psilocybe cubensis]KAH9479911.1 Ribonucleoside-diphosphate reductase small chain [Psilocybe cubensis]
MANLEIHRFSPARILILDAQERLLAKDSRRFVLFPIRYIKIWKAYLHAVTTLWEARCAGLSRDSKDWTECLSFQQRCGGIFFFKLSIASHGIHKRLLDIISKEITVPEAHCYFSFQSVNENVHQEAMAKITHGLTGIRMDDCVDEWELLRPKEKFMNIWTRSSVYPFSERLLVFIFIQGIFGISLSRLLQWFSGKDYLPTMVSTYTRIFNDRECHVDFVSLLFYHLKRRPLTSFVNEFVGTIVKIEKKFGSDLLDLSEIDIPLDDLNRYVECKADALLVSLGYKQLYGTCNKGIDDLIPIVPGELKAGFFLEEMALAYIPPTMEDAILDGQFGNHLLDLS